MGCRTLTLGWASVSVTWARAVQTPVQNSHRQRCRLAGRFDSCQAHLRGTFLPPLGKEQPFVRQGFDTAARQALAPGEGCECPEPLPRFFAHRRRRRALPLSLVRLLSAALPRKQPGSHTDPAPSSPGGKPSTSRKSRYRERGPSSMTPSTPQARGTVAALSLGATLGPHSLPRKSGTSAAVCRWAVRPIWT